MKEDLPNNFDSPPEVADIKTKLRDVHHVVVTGSEGSRYLEAALASLKSMDYNHNRCVEMKNSCDWRHIDPDEVDLVLCREPFGDLMFDKDKTKAMADIFSSMLQASKISEKDKSIDIVIVSEKEILQEVLKFREHDLLEEVVEVYRPTTAEDPADLTGTCNNSEMDFDQATRNQLDLTAVFVERYRDDNLHPASVVNDARTTFKTGKVIVITGPRKCGKTTLAVTLASRYQKNQFMVLNRPDDRKLIRLGSICTVLVEDFAGKNRYNGTYAEAWLREFELLFSAVCSGKLNVIITCEKKKLLQCNEENGPHPILKNTFVLEHVSRIVKQESTCPGFQLTDKQDSKSPNTSTYNRVKKIQMYTIKPPEYVQFDREIDCCQHPDGSFLSLANIKSVDVNENDFIYNSQRYKIVIIHISSDFEYQCNYNTDIKERWYTTKHICCTDTGGVVMSVESELRLYRISGGSLQFIKSTDMKFKCTNISFFKNNIYCSIYGASLILDTNLNIKKRVEQFEILVNYTLPCSLQKYIYTFESNVGDDYIICEDSRIKQLKYLRKEGFLPLCMCAATEDSVFVFGEQDDELKLLQVNTDMTVLLEICIDIEETGGIYLWKGNKMVFDKDNSRLVISTAGDNDVMFKTIYLE